MDFGPKKKEILNTQHKWIATRAKWKATITKKWSDQWMHRRLLSNFIYFVAWKAEIMGNWKLKKLKRTGVCYILPEKTTWKDSRLTSFHNERNWNIFVLLIAITFHKIVLYLSKAKHLLPTIISGSWKYIFSNTTEQKKTNRKQILNSWSTSLTRIIVLNAIITGDFHRWHAQNMNFMSLCVCTLYTLSTLNRKVNRKFPGRASYHLNMKCLYKRRLIISIQPDEAINFVLVL